MPYVVKKSGSSWCVYRKGDDKPVPGGCHPTKAEALDHMKALYVNVAAVVATTQTVEVDPPTIEAALQAASDSGLEMLSVSGTSFWCITNVPICETGISYPLSTGDHTFTPEDLALAVEAQGDPAVVAPRIGLGHDDPRFNGDGEPALGRVENMRLSANEQTIVGDYMGVPEWLAKIMSVAYPNRSIEGSTNVTTVTGNKYPLIITAVKQLGVMCPGVSTLEDIPVLLSAKGPEDVKMQVAASDGKGGQ